MSSFGEGTSKAKDIFELAAAIIVVFGVPAAFYKANSQWSTRYLSNLAMNEEEMGYFAARRRCWLWFISLICIPTVRVPRVPSFGTLIRAGDDGLFSSSMIPRSMPRDPVVSWTLVYEAFFREYAWAIDRRENLGQFSDEWRAVIEGKGMEKYRDEAAFHVWKLKHQASSRAWNRHTRSRWYWPFSALREWCIRHILYPIDSFWHLLLRALKTFVYALDTIRSPSTRFVNQLMAVDVELDLIPQIDCHLLYYPWNVYASEETLNENARSSKRIPDCETGTPAAPGYPRYIRPTLVSSIRPLEFFDPRSTRTRDQDHKRKRLAGDEKGQRLRIYNGVPAVKISEEDLGALCCVLGIEAEGDKFLPGGRGGLGHLLASHIEDGMNIVRLVYHSKDQIENDRSVGGGYSTLFAKHLACGCIPFMRSREQNAVDTLVITPDIAKHIEKGGSVCDKNPPPKRSLWRSGAIRFLQGMPKIGSLNYYHESYEPPKDQWHVERNRANQHIVSYDYSEVYSGRFGTISAGYRISDTTVEDAEKNSIGYLYHIDKSTKKPSYRSKWWRVVAGIAFGGLVPMTTRWLADLVSFSVGGKPKEAEDMEAFRKLMQLMLEDFKEHTDQDGSLLFGRRATEIIQLAKDGMSIDFASEALGTDEGTIRRIVKKLSWLTTLLEALIAMVKEDESSDLAQDPFKAGIWKREQVFEACAEEIHHSYLAAVNGNGENHGIAELLERPIEALTAKKSEISPEDCGTVARCIIMAWASWVRIVDWDRPRNQVSKEAETKHSTEKQPEILQAELALSEHAELEEGLDVIEEVRVSEGGDIAHRKIVRKGDGGEHQEGKKHVERKVHQPMALEELPDIALWE